MKLVYVVSPLSAPTQKEIGENFARAQRLCLLALSDGVAPFASHGFYPSFLDDTDAVERALGTEAGLSWMSAAEAVWVFTKKGISKGMQNEIDLAKDLGIPIVVDPDCWASVDG